MTSEGQVRELEVEVLRSTKLNPKQKLQIVLINKYPHLIQKKKAYELQYESKEYAIEDWDQIVFFNQTEKFRRTVKNISRNSIVISEGKTIAKLVSKKFINYSLHIYNLCIRLQ